MRDDTARAIAAIDKNISPAMVEASQALYQPFHESEPYAGVTVTRDQKYGAASRHRLDVFAPSEPGGERRPVLIYVHGGGFIGGDKVIPNSAYYDNVGVWAVRNGYIGVTMTYPLAPEGKYPEGASSVGGSVKWVLQHIGKYGGDPYNVVLLGQSAGATHVATYAGRPELHASPGGGVRAIALLSGVYQFDQAKMADNTKAYLGTAPDAAAKGSALPGVATSGIPIMFGISENDPQMFHQSAKALFDALYANDGKIPNLLYLPRHNHITQIAHLNAADVGDPLLADRLREFINVHTAGELTAR
jgi:acetyl esterase/lipase